MYKHLKTLVIVLAAVIAAGIVAIPVLAAASGDAEKSGNAVSQTEEYTEEVMADAELEIQAEDSGQQSKSFSAAAVVGVVAAAGAISMGIAISKAVESVARQPEAGGKIQTMLMLGLVFIETAIIYALIVAILIIFVL